MSINYMFYDVVGGYAQQTVHEKYTIQMYNKPGEKNESILI